MASQVYRRKSVGANLGHPTVFVRTRNANRCVADHEPAFLLGEEMSEENSADQKNPVEECAARLGSAAQALERVIGKLEAQYEALNQKIDRIIATVEKPAAEESGESGVAASAAAGGAANVTAGAQAEQVAKLERENRDLRQRVGRRTLVPVVSALLAKSGVDEGVQVESGTLDKALGALTVEQRIAVKAELARAGMIA
jgi:hypothetical protein